MGAFFIAFQSSATTFQRMPLEKLIEESSSAAEVELKSKKSFSNKMGMIFTEFTFAISESHNLDNSDLDGESLKLTMTGGTVDGVTSYIDGAPEFAVGERSFLLLKKIESKIYLSNFTMGKYKIEESEGKTYYVSSVFPLDAEIGRVSKEKMIEVIKLKYKTTRAPENDGKVLEFSPKRIFQRTNALESEKRNPAQVNFEEQSSEGGVSAMWAFLILFLVSGLAIWWKLKKGTRA